MQYKILMLHVPHKVFTNNIYIIQIKLWAYSEYCFFLLGEKCRNKNIYSVAYHIITGFYKTC